MVRYKSMENKIRKVYVWMNSECIKFVQNKLLPKREMPTKTGTSMLTIWYILLMKIEEVLPELYRFAEVCYNHTLHPLWTLSLQHPDTRINHFSITYVCKRNSQDIVHHFVLDCPNIFKRREHLRNFYCPWIHTSSYHANLKQSLSKLFSDPETMESFQKRNDVGAVGASQKWKRFCDYFLELFSIVVSWLNLHIR